jgi:hypothetical protein
VDGLTGCADEGFLDRIRCQLFTLNFEFAALITRNLAAALDTTAFMLACAVLYLASISDDAGHRGWYRKAFLARMLGSRHSSVPRSPAPIPCVARPAQPRYFVASAHGRGVR